MKNKMSVLNLITLIALMTMSFIGASAQFRWGQTDPNAEKLIGSIKVGALREVDPDKPGVYKPYDGETIELGLYAKRLGQWGSIPTDAQAFNSFQVTDGLCQGNADQQAQCRATLYKQGGTFWLPKGSYSVTIRPLPNQGKKIVQTHVNVQFQQGVPEASVTVDRQIGFATAEKNIVVMHFSYDIVKSFNNDVGMTVNGEKIWATGTLTSTDAEAFGFCYGTWPLPVRVYTGDKFNLNPNHDGVHYLQPTGFQAPTVWGRIKKADRDGKQIGISANQGAGPFAATMMVHVTGVVVEDIN